MELRLEKILRFYVHLHRNCQTPAKMLRRHTILNHHSTYFYSGIGSTERTLNIGQMKDFT